MSTHMDHRCLGCGRIEPMGVHYDDCPYVEDGDYTLPRANEGTDRDNENYATYYSKVKP